MRMACGEAKRTEAASKFLETASTLLPGVSTQGSGISLFRTGGGASHTWLSARKSIFQDITQVIVIKQTIEHDF